MASAGIAVQAAGDCAQQACAHAPVVALSFGDLNPLTWLGKGAAAVVTDVWKGAMVALWSAGMWILEMTFKIIDKFTTPDLSAGGPLRQVLPYTLYIGAAVATLMALIQLGAALYQRDGKSLGRIAVGLFQFGLVWVGYLAVAGTLVAATGGLTRGLLQSMLHVDTFSSFTSNSSSWPREVDDTVVATVLGLCAMFLILPAAIGYLLLMLVREAALMLLTVTAPISAGGLLSESTRSWFWKSLRWFIASLLIAPLAALVLGIGVQITQGTIEGNGDQTAQAVGMAVTGSVLVLIGALSPVVLFRLLAFVDPGTSSGAAMRTSLAANGGLAGLIGGGGGGSATSSATSGSGAASQPDGQGRSQGESSADSATSSRFAAGAKMIGGGATAIGVGATIGSAVSKSVNVAADILGAAGVGHQAPYFGHDASGGSYGSGSANGRPPTGAATPGSETGGNDGPDAGPDTPPTDTAPPPPDLPPPPASTAPSPQPQPPPPPSPRGHGPRPTSSPGGSGPAGGAGASGGAAAAAL